MYISGIFSWAKISGKYRKGGRVKIDTEFIKLDSFLKAEGLAASGGEAKMLITDGMVRVNGETEIRRGRKLYPGDRVELEGNAYTVK
jgi:ribosome-associated protein